MYSQNTLQKVLIFTNVKGEDKGANGQIFHIYFNVFVLYCHRHKRYFNKRTKTRRVYTVKSAKDYSYIPQLQAVILWRRLRSGQGLPKRRSLRPDDPRRLGLVPPPPTAEIAHITRGEVCMDKYTNTVGSTNLNPISLFDYIVYFTLLRVYIFYYYWMPADIFFLLFTPRSAILYVKIWNCEAAADSTELSCQDFNQSKQW